MFYFYLFIILPLLLIFGLVPINELLKEKGYKSSKILIFLFCPFSFIAVLYMPYKPKDIRDAAKIKDENKHEEKPIHLI